MHLVSADGVEDWPRMPKDEVARAAGRADRGGAARKARRRMTSTVQSRSAGCRTAPACRCPPAKTRRLGRARPCAPRSTTPLIARAGRAGAGADRLRHRAARRPRGPGAPALRPRRRARRHRAQCARHHRRRLSRRGEGAARSITATAPFTVTRGMRIAQLVVAPVAARRARRGRRTGRNRRAATAASARPAFRVRLSAAHGGRRMAKVRSAMARRRRHRATKPRPRPHLQFDHRHHRRHAAGAARPHRGDEGRARAPARQARILQPDRAASRTASASP